MSLRQQKIFKANFVRGTESPAHPPARPSALHAVEKTGVSPLPQHQSTTENTHEVTLLLPAIKDSGSQAAVGYRKIPNNNLKQEVCTRYMDCSSVND